jgi:hypothetical protein
MHREVLPSTAMIAGALALSVVTHSSKQALNKGLIAAITSHNVSWLGMPCP